MSIPQPKFSALVLAADRGPDDPVAGAAGVLCKSLAPIDGIPMVFRVVNALDASREVGAINLCGPPESIVNQTADLAELIASGKVKWHANSATPSSSAYHVLQKLPDRIPVLLTTADHARHCVEGRCASRTCSQAAFPGCSTRPR